MKRKIVITCCIFLSALLSSCGFDDVNVKSTDLSSVLVDDYTIGDTFTKDDANLYTTSTSFDDNSYTYNLEGFRILTDRNDKIIRILWIMDNEDDVVITINDKEVWDIDDVTSRLGDNYKAYWHDKEQRLRGVAYKDDIRKIAINFIFENDQEGELQYVEFIKK